MSEVPFFKDSRCCPKILDCTVLDNLVIMQVIIRVIMQESQIHYTINIGKVLIKTSFHERFVVKGYKIGSDDLFNLFCNF